MALLELLRVKGFIHGFFMCRYSPKGPIQRTQYSGTLDRGCYGYLYYFGGSLL